MSTRFSDPLSQDTQMGGEGKAGLTCLDMNMHAGESPWAGTGKPSTV